MNVLAHRMLEQGLIDATAARGVSDLLAQGESPARAFAACGLAEERVLQFLSAELDLPYVELEQRSFSKQFLARFPARLILDRHVLPADDGNGGLLAVTADPFDTSAVDELRLATGKDFQLALAPLADIDRCIKRYLGVGADTVQSMISEAGENGLQVIDTDADEDMDLTEAAEGASIIRFVNQILTEAIELRATDVHIEPFEETLRVRYRIDGVLQEASVAPEVKQFQAAIVSRLKILSKLDIAEKRTPQDGRIKIRIAEHEIDVRVSVIPMLYGEAVVLRLLDRSSVLLGLDKLGMSDRDLDITRVILERPHGIILVTGPTGSGKTTTLYSALDLIRSPESNIVTVEDPVEYQLDMVNQIQVHEAIGMTFARALRSILRQDPDVIMVGEIRDEETARVAVQSALTGHLVLATLHTNDAPGAVARLLDMSIEPYLLSGALNGVVAQRLARTVCEHCAAKYIPEQNVLEDAGLSDKPGRPFRRGAGCQECHNSGFRGRAGIYAVMEVTPDIRRLIHRAAPTHELREALAKDGVLTLREEGVLLALEGRTCLEEVLAVTHSEDTGAEALRRKRRVPEPAEVV